MVHHYAITRSVIAVVLVIGWAQVSFAQRRPAVRSPASSIYPVELFGAKCDGGTDDTAAILKARDAALPSGTIVFPVGVCVISSTIVLGGAPGTTSFLSLEGAGPIQSTILWNGDVNGIAVKMVRNKYFTVRNIGIRNANVSNRGTSIGLLQTGHGGGGGTETLGGLFMHVYIASFDVGIHAGEASVSEASDSAYQSLQLDLNRVGFYLIGGNSLNHFVSNIQCSGNVFACVDLEGGSIMIDGGATSHNGTDFYINAEVFTVRNVRAELMTGAMFVNLRNATTARIESNLVTESNDPATVAVRIRAIGSVTIADNVFYSRVVIENYAADGLIMTNNRLQGDTTRPIFLEGTATAFPTMFTNNADNDGVGNVALRYADFTGLCSLASCQAIATHTTTSTIGAQHVLADAGSGGITLTLPAATALVGRTLTVKKIAGAGSVTVDGNGSETIDGSLTLTLSILNDAVMLVSNGTSWYVLTP